MKRLPKPVNLEIKIDEWQAAQGNIEAVRVGLSWRKARTDPTLEPLLAALPPTPGFVPIKLSDGRTEMAPRAWKGLRFGKGPPIYESARKHFEAWASDDYFERARNSTMVTMIRRLIPNFDDYPKKAQIDFIERTQNKIDKVRKSVEDLVNHLEYAAPDKGKAIPPIKEPRLNVRAAVFSALMGTRRAGELLGVPHSDKPGYYENQAVRKMAAVGRRLLCDHYGSTQFDTKIERMQKYHEWLTWLNSKAPKEQMYVLLAKARR